MASLGSERSPPSVCERLSLQVRPALTTRDCHGVGERSTLPEDDGASQEDVQMVDPVSRSAHPLTCAEKIRWRSLLQAGDPVEPPIALLYNIARKIHACCGHTLFKSHRLARSWTVEKAVASFHAMCDVLEIKRRGLSIRSWLEWEAGGVPNRDYQDLLCRLFATGSVQLGFSTDYTPCNLMRLRNGGLTDGDAATIVDQCYGRVHDHSREEIELANPGHSLAESQSLARFHTALTSNRDVVRHVLDESFYRLTNENLFLRIDKIEGAILTLCKHTLLTSLHYDEQDGRACVLENVVRVKNRTLIMKVRADLQFDQLLHFVLQDPESPHFDFPGEYLHTEIWLNDSVGHYQVVRVTLPTHLGPSLCDRILEQITGQLTAGYLWLNERIQRALTCLGGTFEHDSMQLLRRQFLIHGRTDIAHQLWLVKVADGRVTYVVDRDLAKRVLHAGRKFRGLQQAPASIACALLANSIPLDRSFSCRAIGESRTVKMSLTNTPYRDINEDFLVAQSAIYADRMLLTPLAGDRRGWLLAAYPAAIQTDVASVLDATQSDLEKYLSSTPTRMRSPVIRHPT